MTSLTCGHELAPRLAGRRFGEGRPETSPELQETLVRVAPFAVGVLILGVVPRAQPSALRLAARKRRAASSSVASDLQNANRATHGTRERST